MCKSNFRRETAKDIDKLLEAFGVVVKRVDADACSGVKGSLHSTLADTAMDIEKLLYSFSDGDLEKVRMKMLEAFGLSNITAPTFSLKPKGFDPRAN